MQNDEKFNQLYSFHGDYSRCLKKTCMCIPIHACICAWHHTEVRKHVNSLLLPWWVSGVELGSSGLVEKSLNLLSHLPGPLDIFKISKFVPKYVALVIWQGLA